MAHGDYEQTTAYKLLRRIYESDCVVTPELRQEVKKLFSVSKLAESERVRHKVTGRSGIVYKISRSGERAMIRWDGQQWAEGYTKIEMLEVVE